MPDPGGSHTAPALARRASPALIVLGTILLALGGPLFYLRQNVFDSERFAERATSALDGEQARQAISRQIVTLAVEQTPVPVAAARPLLEETVAGALDSQPFRSLLRGGAEQAHRVLFERGKGAVAFTLADTGIALIGALKAVAPAVAKQIPPDISVALVHFNRQGLGVKLVGLGYNVRLLGIVLPILGLMCFIAALALPGERRRAAGRIGLGLAIAGVLLYILLVAGREIVLGTVSDPEIRPAAGAVWDSFLASLGTYALIAGAAGTMLFATATSRVRQGQLSNLARAVLAAVLSTPARAVNRAVRALVALALGVLLVTEPGLAVQLLVVLLGAAAIFFATSEVLELLGPGRERSAAVRHRPGRRPAWHWLSSARGRAAVLIPSFGALLALGAVLAFSSGGASKPSRGPIVACNGYAALCDRTLDRVVFASSHNSMSAAADGFVGANQPRGLVAQLDYGIRGFLIDSYYGVKEGGRVRTVLPERHLSRAQLSKDVGGDAAAAIERLTRGAGFPPPTDPNKRAYLCHVFCEAGSVDMTSALTAVRRWMEKHPDEVLIFFVEDSVTPADTARVFEQSGLLRYVYTHGRAEQWPTLRQMISSGRRLLVLSENERSGAVPWYHDGFSLVQETPYHFTSAKNFSCRPNRGTPDSPLFLLNHWIDNGRPSRKASSEVNRFDVLLPRARACEKERELLPNLVAVDWYDEGDLLGVVNVLNGFPREAKPLQPTA